MKRRYVRAAAARPAGGDAPLLYRGEQRELFPSMAKAAPGVIDLPRLRRVAFSAHIGDPADLY